jgi:SAM-dependent methyltransferase
MTPEAVELFAGLPRQGPGDAAALDRMLVRLGVAEGAAAADMGCGVGATALRLASVWSMRVTALDAAAPLIDRLRRRLVEAPPARGSVAPVLGDMAAPPIDPGSLDLIVSEGAAYRIGFREAMAAWRPLVRRGGVAVVSECVWLGRDRPEEAAAFWAAEYPAMGGIAEAVAAAEAGGWRVVALERLDASAWSSSFYGPLAERVAALADRPGMAAAVADARAEMRLFARTGWAWGYIYLALDTAG